MLPKEKPQEGQLLWLLLLAVESMVLGSAWGSSSSSSDLHLLSPSPGAPLPHATPRPDHPQGPHGPRHHQPPLSIYRSPASLRAGHGELCHHVFFPFYIPQHGCNQDPLYICTLYAHFVYFCFLLICTEQNNSFITCDFRQQSAVSR